MFRKHGGNRVLGNLWRRNSERLRRGDRELHVLNCRKYAGNSLIDGAQQHCQDACTMRAPISTRRKRQRGSTIIEVAVSFLLFFVVLCAIMEFGWIVSSYNILAG